MDGEVLIIGMRVGWFGGVPKGLTSVGVRTLELEAHSLFFEDVFSKAFFSMFCDFWWISGGFRMPTWRPKSIFGRVFFDVFFKCIAASIFCRFFTVFSNPNLDFCAHSQCFGEFLQNQRSFEK